MITEKQFDGNYIKLEDGTTHVYSGTGGIRTLNIEYPEGSFMSTILFSTASSGDISISFPKGTIFAGSAPYEFFPGENWELNIHNKIVVGSQLF
jgi:hypothetical protein